MPNPAWNTGPHYCPYPDECEFPYWGCWCKIHFPDIYGEKWGKAMQELKEAKGWGDKP